MSGLSKPNVELFNLWKKSELEKLNKFLNTKSLTTRSMFGFFGVFYKGEMFALLSSDFYVYIRALHPDVKEACDKMGFKKLSYQKKKKTVNNDYYQLPIDWDHSKSAVKALKMAFGHRKEVKVFHSIPGMTAKQRNELIKVGVLSLEQLADLGAVEVFSKLKSISPFVPKVRLFELEGFIQKVHHLRLSESYKLDLWNKYINAEVSKSCAANTSGHLVKVA